MRPRDLYIALVLALMVTATGCDSLVGADCIDEYSVCGATCVDTTSDPDNCGGCGIECESGLCVDSVCESSAPDAGPGVADASIIDAPLFDAAPTTDAPANPDPDAAPLVDAGVTDASTSPDALTCTLPEVPCGTMCIDISSDPDNCGMCGHECSSGICMANACLGGMTGHVIVIGHDYVDSREGMNRLAGNSVFLALGASVDVLVYEGDATGGAISGTDAAIDQVGAEVGRTWVRTAAATPADVPAMLDANDVFVIYAQEGATDVALTNLGTLWQSALDTFVNTGGVIVLMEGGGTHAGTFQILDTAGLFSATSRTVIVDPILDVVDPGNAIATGVDDPYLGEDTTAELVTSEGTVVVESSNGPVVLHKLFN